MSYTDYCIDDENVTIATSTMQAMQVFSSDEQLIKMYSTDPSLIHLQKKVTQAQTEMANGLLILLEKTHFFIREKLIYKMNE